VCGFLLAGPAGFGQTAAPPGGRIIISGGGTVRLAPRTMPAGQTTPDAFDSMVASAASFDMDSPVEAHAEFDPPEAAVGGRVIYRIEVSALDESLHVPEELPAPAGLTLHAGGRGQTYQPTGAMKLRPMTTVIFHATVANTGTFTMPSFDLMAYGKPVKVPEASLTVVAAGTIKESEPPQLILEPPEGDCFAGQLLRIRLIMPVRENGGVMGMSQPHISGDFIFSEEVALGMRQETVERDGKTFPAWVQEVLITPLRAGEQELVGQSHGYMLRPTPGQTNRLHTESVLIDTEPTMLDVKPLPTQGVLPGFTGAVGSFQIEPPKLSAREVRAGEPLTLTVIVSGDGNLGRLIPPRVPTLPDWQGFPPPTDLTPPSTILQRGFASFEYTFIPLSTRISATPAIPFSCFDPAKNAYVDLTIPPMPITVNPGPAGAFANSAPPDSPSASPNADDSKTPEKEPVLSGLGITPGAHVYGLVPLQQRGWFWAVQILPVMALAALWGWDRRRRFLSQHPEVVLKRRARRGLRRQLRLARKAVAARDGAGFALAGAGAFREVCAAHIAANPGALVCADILLELPPEEQNGRAGEMVRCVFALENAVRFGGAAKENPELLALQPDLERTLEELKERLC
jgi:hypothetical protein